MVSRFYKSLTKIWKSIYLKTWIEKFCAIWIDIIFKFEWIYYEQRMMHSIRMRTTRFIGRLGGSLPRGVCVRGVCVFRGCLPGWCVQVVSTRRVSAQGVCTGECTAFHCMLGYTHTPLWTEWVTDRCKNIFYQQLRLRAVKRRDISFFSVLESLRAHSWYLNTV